MLWYIPTFYGDIRLEAIDANSCRMVVQQATTDERRALAVLSSTATAKAWDPKGMMIGSEGETILSAPIEQVQRVIAEALKPEKVIVSAVQFSDGRMEEIRSTTWKSPSDAGDGAAPAEVAAAPVAEEPKAEKKAGTSVAQPTRGCPAPAFPPSKLRAREALMAFLDDAQRADFEKHDAFIARGASTGRRYMLTSREAPARLAKFGGRTLYDLDGQTPLCVHDWDVPAEEELLALFVFLSLPGREHYLRHLEN